MKKPTKERHRVVVSTGLTDELGEELLRCPYCGAIASLQNYDCMGADDGCIFCNQCNKEISLDGKK